MPPADELGLTVQATESQRGRCTRTVTNRVVKEQEGQAGGQQGDNIGNHEGAAAVVECDVGETPNIAQTNGRTDGREDKDAAAGEAFALHRRLRGRCSHCCKPRMCGDADGWCEGNRGLAGLARVQKKRRPVQRGVGGRAVGAQNVVARFRHDSQVYLKE